MNNIFKKGFNVEESVESSAHSASKRIFYVNDVKVEFWASIENEFLTTEKTALKNNLNIANDKTRKKRFGSFVIVSRKVYRRKQKRRIVILSNLK